MKRIMNAWGTNRNLSSAGKVFVIKTFWISQFLCIRQGLVVPDSVLTQVNRLLFRFCCCCCCCCCFVTKKDCNRRVFEKVKRKVVCGDFENDGLNLIDLNSVIAAVGGHLYQAQALDKWSHIPRNLFAPLGDKYLFFFCFLFFLFF